MPTPVPFSSVRLPQSKVITINHKIIYMKGIAAWIWIIMSVVLGIVVTVFGAKLILDQLSSTQKEVAVENYYDLFYKVTNVCGKGGIGEIYHYKMALPDSVTAIYIGNSSQDFPPPTVPVLVSSGSMAVGDYFCIKFAAENIPHCEALSCNVDMTYFGTPSLKSDLPALIARLAEGSPTYNYDILINKTDVNYIIMTAKAAIG
jgi:hypothetical protein